MHTFTGTYRPGGVTETHSHGKAMMRLIVSGGFVEQPETGPTQTLVRGNVLYMPRHCEHRHRTLSKGAFVLAIGFDQSLVDEMAQTGLETNRTIYFEDGVPQEMLLHFWQVQAHGDTASVLDAGALGSELLCLLPGGKQTADKDARWLNRIKEMLQDSVADSVEIGSIASEVGYDRSHVSRSFRQTYGLTMGQYVRRVRLERACRALTRTEAKLGQIAADAGFFDHAHFTREFKRAFGCTPGAYQKQLLGSAQII